MSSDGVNTGRRRFLTAATSAVGAAGVVGIAVPFVGSWNPSAKARAAGAPVKADISKIEPGAMVIEEWRGKPVYILRRTEEQVADLPGLNDTLKDPKSEISEQPDYVDQIARSRRPEIMVFVGLCTHLGCAPKHRPLIGDPEMGGEDWVGGFFCPCHGSKFDLAGRVYAGVPASANLIVPPYYYVDDNVIVIGLDEEPA